MGLGAVGVYGVVSALLDGNDIDLPEADAATARAAANATLEKVDWNRPVIVIGVPGTGWGIPQELREGLKSAGGDRVSTVQLRYPAAATGMVESAALGKATLRLVLDEIERRDPDGTKYHVALHGESQGAWVVNDVMAEAPNAKLVDRATMFGLPASATHDGAHRDDPRVRITNHPFDPIAWPYLGPSGIAAAAPGLLLGRNPKDAPGALLMMALNPLHSIAFGLGDLVGRVDQNWSRNPHIYFEHYGTSAPEFLLSGAPPAGA